MDVPDIDWVSLHIGTQVRGPSWLTFLGQPVLGELGGVSGLRARLHHPETTVQEMEGDRAVVSLGPWPEAGDTEQGNVLPAYQELARVLEPWLYHEPRLHAVQNMEDTRRWERRFLIDSSAFRGCCGAVVSRGRGRRLRWLEGQWALTRSRLRVTGRRTW